jgi:CubicO group peptidase (beta-lactamase class C family)
MTNELREKFEYCNLGYMLLQHVTETISGSQMGDVYHEAIWDPLDMSSTSCRAADALLLPNVLSYGYSYNELTGEMGQQPWMDTELVGAGMIISSVDDFVKYVRAMISYGLPMTKDMQARLTAPLMLQPRPALFTNSSAVSYAMGWDVQTYRGRTIYHHTGGIPGHTSFLIFSRELNWGAVFLTNSDSGDNVAYAVAQHLLDDMLDVPDEDRQDLVEKQDRAIKSRVQNYMRSRENIYPDVPSSPLPPALPLSEYEGTYSHPGFGQVTLRLGGAPKGVPTSNVTGETLHTEWRRIWNTTIDLEHVSGEY